jgi:hypothetical protein
MCSWARAERTSVNRTGPVTLSTIKCVVRSGCRHGRYRSRFPVPQARQRAEHRRESQRSQLTTSWLPSGRLIVRQPCPSARVATRRPRRLSTDAVFPPGPMVQRRQRRQTAPTLQWDGPRQRAVTGDGVRISADRNPSAQEREARSLAQRDADLGGPRRRARRRSGASFGAAPLRVNGERRRPSRGPVGPERRGRRRARSVPVAMTLRSLAVGGNAVWNVIRGRHRRV